MINETERRRAVKMMAQQPWAILPSALQRMIACAEHGDAALRAEYEERQAALQRSIAAKPGSVAVLPMFGPISMRSGDGFFDMMFGGTALDRFMANFRSALAAPEVKAVVIDVDSPGGSVDGVTEAADEIFAARGPKPIVAVADTWAMSAALHLASQADELVVTPSGQIGSIGVFMMHVDQSRALEAEGIAVTFIQAGANKTEGNSFEPLSDDTRAYFQTEVDGYYAMFVNAMARGRGVSAATVRSAEWGQGRSLLAKDAVAVKMADRVATLAETLQRLGVGRAAAAAASLELERERLAISRARVRTAEAELVMGA